MANLCDRYPEPRGPKPPKAPLSNEPDYVDPKYGQRPVYDFGFGTGKKLGLTPSTPPPTYTETAPFVPKSEQSERAQEPLTVSSTVNPSMQTPQLEMISQNDEGQGMYRRNNQGQRNDTLNRQFNTR